MADDDNLELSELEAETPEPQPAEEGDAVDDLEAGLPQGAQDLEAVYDIPVQVSAVLGKASMQVSQLLKLGRGALHDPAGTVLEEIEDAPGRAHVDLRRAERRLP